MFNEKGYNTMIEDEIKFMQCLDHPSIVKIIDFGLNEKYVKTQKGKKPKIVSFIVLELC